MKGKSHKTMPSEETILAHLMIHVLFKHVMKCDMECEVGKDMPHCKGKFVFGDEAPKALGTVSN